MKKIFILLSAVLVLGACSDSPEKKAQKLIKASLQTTMKDWKSYEPVNFSELDSTFTTVYADSHYKELFKKQREYEELAFKAHTTSIDSKSRKEALKADSLQIEYETKAKDILNEIDKLKENFKGTFDGWKMEHTFRGNNSLGVKTIQTVVFCFDKDVATITETWEKNK